MCECIVAVDACSYCYYGCCLWISYVVVYGYLCGGCCFFFFLFFVFFQAEDGIRDLVRSRGLGDVYKRQPPGGAFRSRRQRRLGQRPYPPGLRRGLQELPPGDLQAVELSLIHI